MPRLFPLSLPMGQIARSTCIASGWMALRVALQMAWLVLVAHALGPDGYGLLAGITALASALGALTGIGFGVLMLQDASRDSGVFSVAWKRALVMSLATGVIFCALYAVFAPHLIGMYLDSSVYLAVGFVELLCFPLIGMASYAFQAHERMGWAGLLHVTIPAGNLVAFALFSAWAPVKSMAAYLLFHALMALVTALAVIVITQRLLSPLPARFATTSRDVRKGCEFSVMRLADTAINVLDKALVLRLSGEHSAGIYSTAYRLISVATLPLVSLSMSALPRLFKAEGKGHMARSLECRLVTAAFAYGLFAGVAVWFLAGLLPILLGEGFRPAVEVARWLVPSPLLQGLYIIGANLLLTQKMVVLRVMAQLLIVAAMILFSAAFIPAFGLSGAVGMLLATQTFAALLVWACYALGRNRIAAAVSRTH